MKTAISALFGLSILVAPLIVQAAAKCQKNCSAADLTREVDELNKEQRKAPAEKQTGILNRKQELRDHISQHQAELEKLQSKLGKPMESKSATGAGKYHCPMHYDQVSNTSAKCPKCGMLMKK